MNWGIPIFRQIGRLARSGRLAAAGCRSGATAWTEGVKGTHCINPKNQGYHQQMHCMHMYANVCKCGICPTIMIYSPVLLRTKPGTGLIFLLSGAVL